MNYQTEWADYPLLLAIWSAITLANKEIHNKAPLSGDRNTHKRLYNTCKCSYIDMVELIFYNWLSFGSCSPTRKKICVSKYK